MNERILNNLLKVAKSRYPFIIDIEYYNMEDSSFYTTSDHNFVFVVDVDMIHNMFPDEEIDYNYIKQEIRVPNVSHIFEYYDKMIDYGDDVNKTIDILIGVITRYDETAYRSYRPIIKKRYE